MNAWISILPVAGVVLGWCLNQITTAYTSSQADKRVLKESLYYLLELHSQVAVLQRTSVGVGIYLDVLSKRLPELTTAPELRHEVEKLMKKAVRPFLVTRAAQNLQQMKDGYGAALLKLAAVDPVSAYELKGVDDLFSFQTQAAEFVSGQLFNNLGVIPEPQTLAVLADSLVPEAENQQHIKIQRKLETVTLRIAQSIGRSTKRNTADILAVNCATKPEHSADFLAYLDETILPLLDKMQAASLHD